MKAYWKDDESFEKAHNPTTNFPSITERTNGCRGCCKQVEFYNVKNPDDGYIYQVEPEDMSAWVKMLINKGQNLGQLSFRELCTMLKGIKREISLRHDETEIMCLRAAGTDVIEEAKTRPEYNA